jgi:hypothetical protein
MRLSQESKISTFSSSMNPLRRKRCMVWSDCYSSIIINTAIFHLLLPIYELNVIGSTIDEDQI